MDKDGMDSLYRSDKRFRGYVDGYAAQHHFGRPIPVREALGHAIVRAYAEMCLEEKGIIQPGACA